MSDPSTSNATSGDLSREERDAALFAQLVLQQTNLTLLLLGKVPNPQTGQTTCDWEGARLFIDQLEMLEAKTKGNLTPEENRLLQQSLMTLRMAFVETVESPAPEAAPSRPQAAPAATTAGVKEPPPTVASATAEEESRKKFTKKY